MSKEKQIDRNSAVAFCIFVWWLHGWPASRIARLTGLTERAIMGRVERRFQNGRVEIGDEGRQMLLDELKAKREDGDQLPDEHFKALPLTKLQQKKTLPTIGAHLLTAKKDGDRPLTRKELRRRAKELEHRKKRDQEGRAPRLLAPFEYLIKTKVLTDPVDAPGPDVGTSGRRREESGLKFRQYFTGTRIGGLKSLDYEGMSGGGNLGLPPTAYRLHCIASIGQLRGLMTPSEFSLLERIIDQDEHLWETIRVRVDGIPKSDKAAYEKAKEAALEVAKAAMFEELRRALDIVAVYEGGLLSPIGFEARWKRKVKLFDKTTRDGAGAVSRDAAGLLEAGRH